VQLTIDCTRWPVQTEEGEKNEAAPEPTLDDETARQLAEEYGAKMREITVASLSLSINPNCFLDFEFDVDPAVREKDEATARELALFLWDTVLPAVTKQVRDGDVQPRDNAAMVKTLHRHGVNMRYLGALLTLAAAEEKEDEELLTQGKQKVHAMPHYWREMLTVEVIARAAKYVLNGYYQSSAVYAAPAQTVASFLNHVLSLYVPAPTAAATAEATATPSEDGKKGKKGKKSNNNKPEPAAVAPVKADAHAPVIPVIDATASREECLKTLQKTIATRFCHSLPLVQGDNSAEADVAATTKFMQGRVSAVALVRRICQACGIQIATRKYNFAAAAPFYPADILALVPVVKSCEPENLLAEFEEMLESSRAFQQEGNHAYAYELAQQALATITQVRYFTYGAQCCYWTCAYALVSCVRRSPARITRSLPAPWTS
jgi:protein TIF31